MTINVNLILASILGTKVADMDGDGKLSEQEASLFEFSRDAQDMWTQMLNGNFEGAQSLIDESVSGGLDQDFDTKRDLSFNLFNYDNNKSGSMNLTELSNADKGGYGYKFGTLTDIFGTGSEQEFKLEDLMLYNQLVDGIVNETDDGVLDDAEVSTFNTLLTSFYSGRFSKENILSALQKALTNTTMSADEAEIINQVKEGTIFDLANKSGWTEKADKTTYSSLEGLSGDDLNTLLDKTKNETIRGALFLDITGQSTNGEIKDFEIYTSDKGQVIKYTQNNMSYEFRYELDEDNNQISITTIKDVDLGDGSAARYLEFKTDTDTINNTYEGTVVDGKFTFDKFVSHQVVDAHVLYEAKSDDYLTFYDTKHLDSDEAQPSTHVIEICTDPETTKIPYEIFSYCGKALDLDNLTLTQDGDAFKAQVGDLTFTIEKEGANWVLSAPIVADDNIADMDFGDLTVTEYDIKEGVKQIRDESGKIWDITHPTASYTVYTSNYEDDDSEYTHTINVSGAERQDKITQTTTDENVTTIVETTTIATKSGSTWTSQTPSVTNTEKTSYTGYSVITTQTDSNPATSKLKIGAVEMDLPLNNMSGTSTLTAAMLNNDSVRLTDNDNNTYTIIIGETRYTIEKSANTWKVSDQTTYAQEKSAVNTALQDLGITVSTWAAFGNSKIDSFTDSTSKVWKIKYDNNGKISKITTDNNEITFDYVNNKRILATADAAEQTRTQTTSTFDDDDYTPTEEITYEYETDDDFDSSKGVTDSGKWNRKTVIDKTKIPNETTVTNKYGAETNTNKTFYIATTTALDETESSTLTIDDFSWTLPLKDSAGNTILTSTDLASATITKSGSNYIITVGATTYTVNEHGVVQTE